MGHFVILRQDRALRVRRKSSTLAEESASLLSSHNSSYNAGIDGHATKDLRLVRGGSAPPCECTALFALEACASAVIAGIYADMLALCRRAQSQ